MSDSSKGNTPSAQTESVKKHGDKLIPDLPAKQIDADPAEQVKGGGWDVTTNKKA